MKMHYQIIKTFYANAIIKCLENSDSSYHQKQKNDLVCFWFIKTSERFSKLRVIKHAQEGSIALPRTWSNINTAKINFNKSYKIETKTKNVKRIYTK